MNTRAWCLILAGAALQLAACAPKEPPAERSFDAREASARFARFDFKRGLLPVPDPAKLDPLDAEFVIVRNHDWPELPAETGYYVADMRALAAGANYQFTARLLPRKDVIVRALATQEALNRAAGITFLAGELANLTPGSDRERTSQDARVKFYNADVLPPERDPKRLGTPPPAPEATP